MRAVVGFTRTVLISGGNEDRRLRERRIVPKCMLALIRNGCLDWKEVLQVLPSSGAKEGKVNRPAADATTFYREEDAGMPCSSSTMATVACLP